MQYCGVRTIDRGVEFVYAESYRSGDMAQADNQNTQQVIEILMREWDQRRTEIVSTLERYAKQEQILTLYLTIVALVTLALLTVDVETGKIYIAGKGLLELPPKVREHFAGLVIIVLSGGVTLAFYFISGLMEVLNWVQALSARSAAIEAEINARIGSRLLTWDTFIVPALTSGSFLSDGPFLSSSILQGCWAIAIFSANIALLSFVCYVVVREWFWFWAPTVWVLVIYHVLSWVWMVTARRNDTYDLVSSLATFGANRTPDERKSRLKRSLQKLTALIASRGGWVAGGATFFLGFAPFAAFSLSTRSFWPRAHVSLPLTLVPSVIIGDSVLLPLFNCQIYPLVRRVLNGTSRSTKLKLLFTGIVCLTACSPIIVYEHQVWSRDQYTGFIKLAPGHLSLAGVWHIVFASFETALAMWFCLISVMWAKDRDRLPRRQLMRAWTVFLCYAFLSVFDLLSKRHFVSADPLRLADMIALSPIALTAIVYLVLWKLSRTQRSS